MKIKDSRNTDPFALEFHDTKPGKFYESMDNGALYLGMELDGQRHLLPLRCTGLRKDMVEDSSLSRGRFRLLDATLEIK